VTLLGTEHEVVSVSDLKAILRNFSDQIVRKVFENLADPRVAVKTLIAESDCRLMIETRNG